MKRTFQVMLVLVIALILGVTVNAGDRKVCQVDPALSIDVLPDIVPPASPKGTDDSWIGTVRVFLVEPMSRWEDFEGYIYKNALIDIPINDNVTLDDGNIQYFTAEWDAADATFLTEKTISESNIKVVAVAFNGTVIPSPAGDYWFNARYADAAASAIPGWPGRNSTFGGFTHTVFVEESSAST